MSFLIDSGEPRSLKAIEIAATAGQWLRVKAKDGRALWGIPAACQPSRFYLVSESGCDCEDSRRHPSQPCKHVLAVRLHTELTRAMQPKKEPARPILQMVRHADGDLTWERARRYSEIQAQFSGDS